jgi:nucleotide-binding universal stress UspA family protein
MDKIKKILAPTDFSEASGVGVRSAINLARAQGAEVIVYHVIAIAEDWTDKHEEFMPVRSLLDERKRLLDEFLRKNFSDVFPEVTIRQEVELGSPYKNIVDKAASEDVDLIVMSTHGRTGLAHMLMGSVTEKVVGHSRCPVLSIPAAGPRVGGEKRVEAVTA